MFAINEWMWYDMDKMQVHKVLNRNAIAFYEGWLTAAMNLNLGIVLVHSLGVHKRNQLYIFWACTVPLIIALETAHIVVGGGLDSLGFVVSCIYACIGAAISSYRSVTSNGNTDISLDLKKNSD